MINTNDYDTSSILVAIGGAAASIIAALVFVRDWIKARALTDTNRDAAINGVEINNTVLKNLQEEITRLTKRVAEVEERVEHLTDKLASVRMVAIDCYALANKCTCDDTETKGLLLEHLKQIIREA